MALTVKSVTIWRQEVENEPGRLARSLVPLAAAGADLKVLMGYRIPGQPSRAVLEFHPIEGARTIRAARAAGLVPADTPSLLVEGDDAPGLGLTLSQALADAGIGYNFLVAQVAGRKFSAVMGFDGAETAKRAAGVIRKVGSRRTPAARMRRR